MATLRKKKLKRMAEATAKAELMAKQEAEARKGLEADAERKMSAANAQAETARREMQEAQITLKRNHQAWADYSEIMAFWEYAPADVRDQLMREAETRSVVSDEINRLAAHPKADSLGFHAVAFQEAQGLNFIGLPI